MRLFTPLSKAPFLRGLPGPRSSSFAVRPFLPAWIWVVGILSLAGGSSFLVGCGDDEPPEVHPQAKGVIVLGFDGMDPLVLRECFRRGLTPNMKRLSETGSFTPLGTSTPPQSPVAWANFITGQKPSGHRIYDFIHRDLDTMAPYLSTSKAVPPEHTLEIGDWVFPLSSGGVKLLRRGRPFWEYLTDKGIPATVVRIPSHFPPVTQGRARVLSGMGTPDLMGTYGTFQIFSDRPKWRDAKTKGGRFHELSFRRQHATGSLTGPANPMDKKGHPMKLGVKVVRDKSKPVLLIRIADREVLLTEGEWSRWIPVAFSPGPFVDDVPGMVRFFVKEVHPQTTLYVSPINIDPLHPSMPVTSPAAYGKDLAQRVGRFYTQGMAEDTKALEAGVLTDEEFLELARQILRRRVAMLRTELKRFQGGLLFVYFSSTDQVSHMFWRTRDPEAPQELSSLRDTIPRLYAEMDEIVGEVLDSMGSDTQLIIMSDHGFAPCKKNFELNTWLSQQGFLVAKNKGQKATKGPMGYVDWSKTQAYGMGLNGLYLNLKGREPHGVVPASERDALLKRIGRQLRATRDPETGARIVTRTFVQPMEEAGDDAPDLIVGYNRGYRCGSRSATGGLSDKVLVDNEDKWTGDHCMDPALVPGVFLSTSKLAVEAPRLEDIAPTVLRYFGVPIPKNMKGKALFRGKKGGR